MESTVSVSKGVFLFPNGFNKLKLSKKKPKALFERLFTKELWYETFKSHWESIENQIQDLHHRTYSILLNDIVNYIHTFSLNDTATDGIVPSATLLTGINQPDHVSQFNALIEKISDEVTPHTAMVSSQDAPTLKHLVENVVWQLIHGQVSTAQPIHMEKDIDYYYPVSSNGSHGENSIEKYTSMNSPTKKKLRKNQCTMKSLQNWYSKKYLHSPKKKKYNVVRKPLVVIFPDFESFHCSILQDFVMIVSSYITSLPVVFVFGVATSVSALHKSFPYHVSSKLLIKVFQSHSSPDYMNQVLEDIFLTHTSPLHFSGKAFELLTDVFLFYDFSVTGLVHSIKYCMMEHYYGENIKSLCVPRERIEEVIKSLNAEDLENIRQLLSFRPFVEAQDCRTQIKLLEDNVFFRGVLYKEIVKLHDYLYSFYFCLKLLTLFVRDLPKNDLGKTVREVFTKCITNSISDSQAFKECMQLFNFQSQINLVENIKIALKFINSYLKIVSPVKPLRSTPTKNNLNNINLNDDLGESFVKTVRVHMLIFLRQIENANTEATVFTFDDDCDMENIPGNRHKLKKKLLQATRSDTVQSEFEMVRSRFVSYIEEVFTKGLQPPHSRPFHEIYFFGDVASVKKQIVGSPRGALHTALSNPVHYLQCSCCHLPTTESMSDSLPDVSLAYKLHRECGKHINLYDWLQAFAAVLKPDDESGRLDDVTIQARFTRAVAELQFLGFIKSSKRKTDHVMRLTW